MATLLPIALGSLPPSLHATPTIKSSSSKLNKPPNPVGEVIYPSGTIIPPLLVHPINGASLFSFTPFMTFLISFLQDVYRMFTLEDSISFEHSNPNS